VTTLQQIGDITPHTSPPQITVPTIRDHPPFILPIPKPLADHLYLVGDSTTQPALEEAKKLLNELSVSDETVHN
jgi:hypothetical protein